FLPRGRPVVALGLLLSHRGTGIGETVKRASPPATEALICIPAPRRGWTSRNPVIRIYVFFSLFLNGRATIPIVDCPPSTALAESLETGRRQELGMRKLVARFLADQSGATAIEYCIIAAGISI